MPHTMPLQSLIGVPSDTPVQTINVPLPTDSMSLVLLIAFAIGEILPFLGGRFKQFNGLAQTLVRLLSIAKPFRKEDEAVAKMKAELAALKKTLGRQGLR